LKQRGKNIDVEVSFKAGDKPQKMKYKQPQLRFYLFKVSVCIVALKGVTFVEVVFNIDTLSEWALQCLVFGVFPIDTKKISIINSTATQYPEPTSLIRERAELQILRVGVSS
jgi:hypothetical protein